MKRRHITLAAAAAIAAAAMTLSNGEHQTGSAQPAPSSATAAHVTELLAQVAVVDDIPDVTGYQRGCGKNQACVFGPAWNDPQERSGCDARNRLLQRSLQDIQFKPGTHNCKVIAGRLDPDPYTGQAIDLKHVAADHILPLKAAWNAGAAHWDLQQRRTFANDMTELVAVSSSANSSKGDSTPSEWLPQTGKCLYANRYLTVAVKYRLPITVKDRAAIITACSTN
jgi:hypothetical protein